MRVRPHLDGEKQLASWYPQSLGKYGRSRGDGLTCANKCSSSVLSTFAGIGLAGWPNHYVCLGIQPYEVRAGFTSLMRTCDQESQKIMGKHDRISFALSSAYISRRDKETCLCSYHSIFAERPLKRSQRITKFHKWVDVCKQAHRDDARRFMRSKGRCLTNMSQTERLQCPRSVKVANILGLKVGSSRLRSATALSATCKTDD